MADLIDREQAIDAVENKMDSQKLYLPIEFKEILRELPSAELSTNLAEVGTDMVSRQAAIDALSEQAKAMESWSERYAEQRKGILTAVNIVSDVPSAEPQERKTGKWILHKNGDGTCKLCRYRQSHVWDLDNWQNYCGHCGAHMTEAEGEDGGGQ